MPTDHTTRKQPSSGPGMLPAYAVSVLTMLSGIVWAVVTLTHLGHPRLQDVRTGYASVNVLVALGLALNGMAFVARRSGRAVGRLLLVSGCVLALGQAISVVAVLAHVDSVTYTAVIVVQMIAFSLFGVVVYGMPLWLPDGRLPRRWGLPCVVLVSVWSVLQQYYEFALPGSTWYNRPTPLDHGGWARVEGWLTPWMDTADAWVPSLMLAAGLVVMAVRWRRTPKGRRAYWILVVPYLLWVAAGYLHLHADIAYEFKLAAFYVPAVLWPVALGYVHVRDRTWALDRAARRMLTALLLTFVMFLAYAAGGAFLSSISPGSLTAEAQLVALLALIVGALLRPTARWATRVAEHYYYGERAQPYQAVRELADRLGTAPHPDDAPRLLCDTVVHTLKLPGARLVVVTRGGPRELAGLGETGPGSEAFHLVHQGDDIGYLLVPPRPGELVLDHQDREAVQILADQGAPAIASLRLHKDLQTSREKIVMAREEERRRLRHDLHDGLGPALSGLRLQVDAVHSAIRTDVRASEPLRVVSAGIGRAIDELRHITDGLAPAALDGADLPRALRQLGEHLAGRRLRITVVLEPDPFPKLPAAVEVAVYRIAAEALNNVVRHSRADHAHASVGVTSEVLTMEIRDDGVGIPEHEHERGPGVGLRSMAERSEELGGRFTLTSTADGTVVRAVFPCSPAGRRAGTGT